MPIAAAAARAGLSGGNRLSPFIALNLIDLFVVSAILIAGLASFRRPPEGRRAHPSGG